MLAGLQINSKILAPSFVATELLRSILSRACANAANSDSARPTLAANLPNSIKLIKACQIYRQF